MRISSTRVEQVTNNGEVVIDYGEVLDNREINEIVINSFNGTYLKDGNILGRYDKTDFCLYIKNINYLGNPHPIFKKRIQIPDTFKNLFDNNANRKSESFGIKGIMQIETLKHYCLEFINIKIPFYFVILILAHMLTTICIIPQLMYIHLI